MVSALKESKLLQFFATILTILCTVAVGSWWISGGLSSLEARMTSVENEMAGFKDFRDEGYRFTDDDGDRLESRIVALEDWTRNAPPQWFQKLFDEFKSDMKAHVEKLETQILQLSMDLHNLKIRIDSASPREG